MAATLSGKAAAEAGIVACDGSELRTKSSIDQGPTFDALRENHDEWEYLAKLYLQKHGFAETIEGKDRAEKDSDDVTVANKYDVKNRELFRLILRMIRTNSMAGKELLLRL